MEVSIVAGNPVVSLKGDLDVYSAPVLRARLIELIASDDNPQVIIFDLEHLEFIDSGSGSVLLGTLKRLRAKHGADGQVVIRAASTKLMKFFEITGLYALFRFER